MKKIKLFSMLALLLMAVSTNAKITWDNTNVFVEANQSYELSSWEPNPLTFEGVTISFSGPSFSRFQPYNVQNDGAARLECWGDDGDSFTFTAPSGKQFVKIEINDNSSITFTEYGDWTQPENNQILWSGTATSTVTLGGSDATFANELSSIVFYFEEDLQEPYTLYFHPNDWAGTYAKYAVQSWSDNYYAAVYSEFMTPVAGHEGWFSTSVPGGNSNLYVCAYNADATNPATDYLNFSWQREKQGGDTYYYNNIDYMEDWNGKLFDGRLLIDNILFKVDDENKTAEVAGGQGYLYQPNTTIPSTITYKSTTYTVTTIGYEAYSGAGISSISIPSSVKTIAQEAFWDCPNLTSITIPESVETIGKWAFSGSALISVTIPSSVTSFDWNILSGCQSLTDVTLAEGLTILSGGMFQDCNALEHITIPNSIKELPAAVLAECDNLNSVTLGTGVDTIGENAFSNCKNLARLTIYAPAPPAVNGYNHPELVETCSLMVPSSVKAAYQAHPYWSKYEIKGIYIVTFKDFNGNTLKAEAVEEGQSASAPDAPGVECYTFNRWDVDFSNVHSDLEVNALYTQNVYTVTFLNEGVQHYKQQVFCGEDVTKPADPTKEGYHFTGWDAEFTNVQSNLTINATFEINKYTVTFKDSEGNTIGEPQVVEWNKAAEAPKAPEVECNHFTGWDKAFEHVTEDLVVTAQYAINQYEVKFLNWNGDELKKQTVDCAGDAEAPEEDPSREGYTFKGWDAAFTNVHSNLTINAQFEINKFTVTFKDWDGEVLKTQTDVPWNTAATAPDDPKRDCHTFTGWDKAFSNVKENLVVTALYSKNTYTVIFKDNDGTVLDTQNDVECGSAAIAPAAPHHTGYTFTGWDTDFSEVTSDLVVIAQFKAGEEAELNVQFIQGANILNETPTTFMIPAAPAIEGFKFIGWRPVANIISDKIQIEAVYEEDSPTAAPEIYTNPANPAQKLVRDGNVYILRDGHEYTITGLKVK